MSQEGLSPQRKEELREAGIFPRSRDITSLFLLVSLCWIGEGMANRMPLRMEQMSMVETPDALVALFAVDLMMIVGVVFVAALSSSLLQSRFLLRLQRRSTSRRPFPLYDALARVLKFFLLLGYGFLAFRLLMSGDNVQQSARTVLRMGFGLLVLCALLDRYWIGFLFHARHGMSREELTSESAEGEVRPEFRQASRDAFL